MISDTLFSAIDEIEKQQADGAYDGCEREIAKVKTVMRGLQQWLDAAPSPGGQAVAEALRALDTTKVEAAMASE